MTAGANQMTSRATTTTEGGPPSPAGQVRAFVDAFERLGCEVEPILAAVGLRRSALDDPDALIPCAQVGGFMSRASRARFLPNLGVRLATVTPNGSFPVLDYLAGTCDDVRQAFEQVAQYLHLGGAPVSIDVSEDEDPVRVRYLPHPPAGRFAIEYTVTLHVFRLRDETDNRARVEYVSFTHQPDDPAEIERLIGCPVRVLAPWAGFALSRDAWRQPLRRRDPVLHAMLERHAGDLSARLPALDGIALDVRRAIVSRTSPAETRLDTVARELALSPRTLQRRLAASGWSFDALVDQTCREIAEKHLSESVLSIAEIAYLLGYSEPAAFHRAFKRWTGATPQAFRGAARAGRLTEASETTVRGASDPGSSARRPRA